MARFFIHEDSVYEVEGETAQDALDRFLDSDDIRMFHCTVNERRIEDEHGDVQEVEDH